MLRVLGLLLLALLLAPLPARAGDLTLRDLIELHRAGLGEELLVAVIQADGGPFRLSHAEILDLKTEGLSERVIAALVRTGSRTPPPVTAVVPVEELVEVAPEVVPAEDAPEVLQVEPQVVVVETVVPYLVPYVVTAPRRDGRDDHGRGDDGSRGRGDRHDSRQNPPATWVTRAEDGRNIAPNGRPVRSDTPRATWVTPNDFSKGSDSRSGNSEKAGRGDDRDDRRGSRSDGDRKPRP